MEVISLQSGSSGNCFFVEAGGVRLLIDAGISGRQAELRLAAVGRDIRQVDALLLTHDHRDHAQAAGIFQRKFGLPIYGTPRTLTAIRRRCHIGPLSDVRFFQPEETLEFGSADDAVRIHSIPTPHDAADGVVFVIEYRDARLGLLTDLGHVFAGLRDCLMSLDAVILESNYDRKLLHSSDYPESLKRRIRGPGGHISNGEAAELLGQTLLFGRLQWACLCHLSGENNSPALVLETHRRVIGQALPLYVAERHIPSAILRLSTSGA